MSADGLVGAVEDIAVPATEKLALFRSAFITRIGIDRSPTRRRPSNNLERVIVWRAIHECSVSFECGGISDHIADRCPRKVLVEARVQVVHEIFPTRSFSDAFWPCSIAMTLRSREAIKLQRSTGQEWISGGG